MIDVRRRSSLIAVRLLTAALFALGLAATVAQIIFSFSLSPVSGQLFGSLDIYWRGVLAAAAIVWGLLTAIVHQRAFQPDWDGWRLVRIVPSVVLGGVIGGRIAALLLPQPSLAVVGVAQFADAINQLPVAFNLRQGGVALAGILLGGGLILAAWGQLKPGVVYGVLAGQIVLIWANLLESSFFGPPTSFFLSIPIAEIYRPPQWIIFDRFHPLFMYEAAALMVIFIFLPRLKLATRTIWPTLGGYLALYGPVKAFLTVFDPNAFRFDWGGVRPAGWTLVWLAAAGVGWLLINASRAQDGQH